MATYQAQHVDDTSGQFGPSRPRQKFVLCFDGTGNKFQGNSGDSNILKIYSMLDRTDGTQFNYYQPGIGTYTTTKSLSSDGMISRAASWYNKAKDSAIGITLDEHVMAGYKFLMRYYQTGDDIYFFGFSRGAYIARFLAEMLDHVGLLSAGNEELVRFVWKTFAKWQTRQGGTSEKDLKKKGEMFRFMVSFRETFSRPVRRIRFLGLFDTVNSVSKFETAWMERSKEFPYTARSSALIIRHAVAIDERRAKFRQDLLSQKKQAHNHPHHRHLNEIIREHYEKVTEKGKPDAKSMAEDGTSRFAALKSKNTLGVPGGGLSYMRYRSRSRGRSREPSKPLFQDQRDSSVAPGNDGCDSDEEDENIEQDIDEIWFPGGHADIGGGWPPDEPEKLSLAHGPLVWMVREAQKAGLLFIPEKLRQLKCYYDDDAFGPQTSTKIPLPSLEINDKVIPKDTELQNSESGSLEQVRQAFIDTLEKSCTRGHIHDCLSFGNGIDTIGVLGWSLMEYLPFKRMDLRPNGTWKAIRWPLPMGEVRDIPDGVKVHHTVIKRMKYDTSYRPGNLIIGGGGRGLKRAPESYGIGEWTVLKEEGHPIGEVWVKKPKKDKGKENGKFNENGIDEKSSNGSANEKGNV